MTEEGLPLPAGRFSFALTPFRGGRPDLDAFASGFRFHEAARLRGLPGGSVRAPAEELTDAERRRVRELVHRLEVLLGETRLVGA